MDLQSKERPGLLGCLSECGEVVVADLVLIPPEQSNERTIGPLLTLGFPAVVVDLAHGLVGDAVLHFLGNSLAEGINKKFGALLLVIDCRLLKAINDPLAIGGRDVDFVLFQVIYCCFCDLIKFLIERPVLFFRILIILIARINVLHIVIRYY